MDLYEDLILQYLTKDAHVFVSPQYSIRGDKDTEWSCPDFIALNFRERVVSIVEVSSACNPEGLRQRVKDRDKQWIDRLKNQLKENSVVDSSWAYRVEVFIRKQAEAKFKDLTDDPGVKVHILDSLEAPWHWRRSYLPGDKPSSADRAADSN